MACKWFTMTTLQSQIDGGGTIAVFWIFTTVGDSYLTPSPLRHFENFEKYTYKTNQNSYFLLEFYIIKQQSESFANCFLSITVCNNMILP